jgi:dolichol-phosphate mannosyltransferase
MRSACVASTQLRARRESDLSCPVALSPLVSRLGQGDHCGDARCIRYGDVGSSPTPRPGREPFCHAMRDEEKQLNLALRTPNLQLPRSKVTIVVPCYNESSTIMQVIDTVKALPLDSTILVIDNCSTDGTRELLLSLSTGAADRGDIGFPCLEDDGQVVFGSAGIYVVLQPQNRKKGVSVRMALALANSEYIICQDADLEYDPDDIVRLLQIGESARADAVFGSRLMVRQQTLKVDTYHLGRVALSFLFSALYGQRLSDVATCYKLLRTSTARSLPLRSCGFDLDFEIPARLRRAGHSIIELPISYEPRSLGQGKKIRWHHAFAALWVMVRIRFLDF